MRLWSAEWPWYTLVAVWVGFQLWHRAWRQIGLVVWMALTIGLADIVAHFVLKPWFGRLRPCRTLDFIQIVESCSGVFSFPSNHATNAAVFTVLWFCIKGPRYGAVAAFCSVIVGFSRVYLGVHYPTDIMAGFLFGGSVGFASFLLLKRSRLWQGHSRDPGHD